MLASFCFILSFSCLLVKTFIFPVAQILQEVGESEEETYE